MSIFSKLFGSGSEIEKRTVFKGGTVRQTILYKQKLNPETKCSFCEDIIGDNDVWTIELRNSLDTTRKDTKLLSVCQKCYAEKYGIYPLEDRKIPTPKECAEYSKLSTTERNTRFFQSFPKEFWERLRVGEDKVLPLIDFLLDGESNFYSMSSDEVTKIFNADSTTIVNQIDEYTKKAADGTFSDEFMVPKTSLSEEEVLFYDRTIPDNFSRILSGELLIFGIAMLNVLPNEKKNELLKKLNIRDFGDEKFQWNLYSTYAATIATAHLEVAGVFKRTITPTFPYMVVRKIGLLKYLHWLRKFGVSYDLTRPAEHLYRTLLS